jgi:hypothetical protein
MHPLDDWLHSRWLPLHSPQRYCLRVSSEGRLWAQRLIPGVIVGSDNSSGYQPVPFIETSCSHRLWGLPSSSGFPFIASPESPCTPLHEASWGLEQSNLNRPLSSYYTWELDNLASMDFTLVRQPVILHRTCPESWSLRHLRLLTGVHPTTA